MLISLTFKTPLINKPLNETWASELRRYRLTLTGNSLIKIDNNKINSLQTYDSAQNHRISTQNNSEFAPTEPQNVEPPPYSKAPSRKVMILTKLVGVSMIFQCIELHMS
jgi:hypothetical protein